MARLSSIAAAADVTDWTELTDRNLTHSSGGSPTSKHNNYPESRDEPRHVSSEKGIKDAGPGVHRTSIQTGGVILLVPIVLGTFVLPQPKRIVAKGAISSPEPDHAGHGSALSPASAFALQLVRIERQTHDRLTLRFRLANGAKLKAKPGQFMTFAGT